MTRCALAAAEPQTNEANSNGLNSAHQINFRSVTSSEAVVIRMPVDASETTVLGHICLMNDFEVKLKVHQLPVPH